MALLATIAVLLHLMAAADPAIRRLSAQEAASRRWAKPYTAAERAAATRPAREARLRQIELEIDPDGQLPPDELKRAVRQRIKADMARLARLAVAARAARRAQKHDTELDALIDAEESA